MRNHVTNRIQVSGPSEIIAEMLERVKDDKLGLGTVDFNKIIPMPEPLNIVAGSRTDEGLQLYKDFVEVYIIGESLQGIDPMCVDTLSIPQKSEDAFLEYRKEHVKPIDPEVWKLGKTAYQNIRQFGSPTWYEWSIQHWGTKWNAYDYEEDHDYAEDFNESNELRFQTAWNAPGPIMSKLAEMFPQLTFEHRWADEDLGKNCGRQTFQNGESIEEYYPDDGKEAIEFAAEVMDAEPSDWGLHLNASGTNYVGAWREEFDLVTFMDKPALFSDKQITDDDIPMGINAYYLHSNQDGLDFASLDKKIDTTFSGTLLISEELDLGPDGILSLADDNNAPLFTGQQISIDAYVTEEYSLETEDEGQVMDEL